MSSPSGLPRVLHFPGDSGGTSASAQEVRAPSQLPHCGCEGRPAPGPQLPAPPPPQPPAQTAARPESTHIYSDSPQMARPGQAHGTRQTDQMEAGSQTLRNICNDKSVSRRGRFSVECCRGGILCGLNLYASTYVCTCKCSHLEAKGRCLLFCSITLSFIPLRQHLTGPGAMLTASVSQQPFCLSPIQCWGGKSHAQLLRWVLGSKLVQTGLLPIEPFP